MGLEAASYITGLTASWPPSGDPKSQGDDHIRLLKSVLQATFPNAAGPFYLPKTEAVAGTLTLDVTDQGNVVMVTTTAADVSVVLPSGFTTTNAGWACEVVKVSSDVNAAVVTPASGTISSRVGNTSSIRVGALFEPAKFLWTGSGWICVKPGPLVGSTINWDGPTIPYGCLALDGSAFSSTTFAELFAVYGSTTLRDKRGRVEAGVDGGVGRLSATYFGASPVNGAVGGSESNLLDLTRIPNHRHAAPMSDPGHAHSATSQQLGIGPSAGGNTFTGGIFAITQVAVVVNPATTGVRIQSNDGGGFDATNAAGGGQPHANVQHTIVTQKLVRAC